MIAQHHEVNYDDAAHRYYVGDTTYISATQLVAKFHTKFDVIERSEYMAHRYGNTPEYWRAKWKRENLNSLDRGNGIHNYEENKLYRKGYDLLPYPVPVQERVGGNGRNKILINLTDGVYPEMMLWRHDCKIAGRADKAIIASDTIEEERHFKYVHHIRRMSFDDHKTNKIIRTESFQREGKYDMMLGPIDHLQDCELNHYILQLSIYQYMAEYHGFYPGKRRILHHRHLIPGVASTGEPKIIELPYLRDEVIAMIKAYAA